MPQRRAHNSAVIATTALARIEDSRLQRPDEETPPVGGKGGGGVIADTLEVFGEQLVAEQDRGGADGLFHHPTGFDNVRYQFETGVATAGRLISVPFHKPEVHHDSCLSELITGWWPLRLQFCNTFQIESHGIWETWLLTKACEAVVLTMGKRLLAGHQHDQ